MGDERETETDVDTVQRDWQDHCARLLIEAVERGDENVIVLMPPQHL